MKFRICLPLVSVILLISSLAFSRQTNKAENLYQEGLMQMEGRGNYSKALDIFGQIIKDFRGNRQISARSQYQIGVCYEKLGKSEAQKAYERVIKEFADQSEVVAQARLRLAALGGPRGAGELVTRRLLMDASGVSGFLTADGKYIRGMDWKTGDVVQLEVASGETSRITNKGPWREQGNTALGDQAFSRDGKQIVYNVESSDSITKDWLYQLRVRNLDGSGLRTFYSEKDSLVYPLDWSPDAGSILALREGNKASELTLISIVHGSVRVLKSIDVPTGWLRASFSHDGRFVAFSSVSEGSQHQGDVRLMTVDGRNEVVIAAHPSENRLLGWTPDGERLVFLSDRSGTWDIWSVHIAEGKQLGEPELLKKDFGYYSQVLGFAADGSCYYTTHIPLGGLYYGAVDLETGKLLVPLARVTTRYIGPPSGLTWSPDGRNLLYISLWGFGPGKDILTIRSTASGEERILSGLRFVNQISWAPDGRSVIAIGSTDGVESGILRIDTQTSEITRLADVGLCPKLCPDGKTLVSAMGPVIRKRNLDTGEESEVVNVGTGGTAQMYYDLSPDGREVVFQKDSTVNIVSLNGGEPREIFRGPVGRYGLRWTRDGRYIIVRANGAFWRVPAKGGTPLKVNLHIPKMESFALHPDNSRFAVSFNEGSKSELWVIENFLSPSKSLGFEAPAPATPVPVKVQPAFGGKVLMIVNEGESADLELMLTKEVGVMKSLLGKAGFEVVVSTGSGQLLAAGVVSLKPDLKLRDVQVADYKGFILPCMAVNAKPLPPEGYAIIKEAVAKGKPLAAQTGSVLLLARAGVLVGRRYAGRPSWIGKYPELRDAVYSGDGVVQDGTIITSGNCPFTAEQQGVPDGTSKLTEALIAELRR